jgi:Type VI secretion system VasI, EvfG, VC_A0118
LAAISQPSGPEALPLQATASTVARPGWKNWQVAVMAAAAFAVGGVGIIMGRPTLPSPAPTVYLAPSSPRAPEVLASRIPSGSVDPSRAPKWARTRQSGRAGDGSRAISFELEAENEVRVWMNRVRPVLTVRCLERRTEVFVVTDSAMSIESTPDQHTVHISFDGQAETEERWFDSAAKRDLFAPDGIALAVQLAHAHTLRFGFTPFSASPVVAEFDVRGFAEPLESLARTCGWKGN